MSSLVCNPGESFPHNPGLRGLLSLHRRECVNRCPGCGRSHWLMGRFSAECAFCSTALPLEGTAMLGAGTYRCRQARKSSGEWDVSR